MAITHKCTRSMQHNFFSQSTVREQEDNGQAMCIATLQSIGYEIEVVVDVRDTQQFFAYVFEGHNELPHSVTIGKNIVDVERLAMQSAVELMLADLIAETSA